MRRVMIQCLEAFYSLLPFLKKKDVEKIREFSLLVSDQYQFLIGQLEKFQLDYFELSDRVRRLHEEIMELNRCLKEARNKECSVEECNRRK